MLWGCYVIISDLLIAGSDYREGAIHLVGGFYSWEGRVEIYLDGEWGIIVDSQHYNHRRDAHVVCRQLGYDTRCELKYCSGHNFVSYNYLCVISRWKC